jgi:hypothetical protein
MKIAFENIQLAVMNEFMIVFFQNSWVFRESVELVLETNADECKCLFIFLCLTFSSFHVALSFSDIIDWRWSLAFYVAPVQRVAIWQICVRRDC